MIIKIPGIFLSVVIGVCFTLSPGNQVSAQEWETVFSGSNANNSAGEYYIEGDTLLLGRKGGGLKYSEDGGATWNEEAVRPLDSDSKLGKFFKFKGDYYLHRLDYGNDNFLRSTDDFATWEVLDGLPKRSDGSARGLALVANNDDIIFMKTWSYLGDSGDEVADFLISEDGDEWTRVGDAIDYGHFTFVGDDLFASAGNVLMKSSNYGETWDEVGELADSLKFTKIFSAGGTLYAEGENREDDFNEKRKFALAFDMEEGEWKSLLDHKTFRAFGMHANGQEIGIIIYDVGFYYSPDAGENWYNLNTDAYNPYSVYLDGDYFYATGPGSGFGETLKRTLISNFQELTSSEIDSDIPASLILEPNYPNPFNPSTNITFRTQQSGHASLRIFDVTGREIAVIVDGFKSAGTHTVSADLSGYSSGMYFYQLSINGQTKTQKMTLLK